MARLFFSYSHEDEALRDELEIHLSMLKRQEIIDVWHDRRIGAGSELDTEISQQLDSADIVLLLVSPYFLASNYCYDKEMTRALEMHDAGEAVVIPIILHPCDWHSAPFGKLLATPTDGRPISKYPNQHDAFLDVVTSIRGVATKAKNQAVKTNTKKLEDELTRPNNLPRSSNLRIKKDFTEQQKDEFLENTFEYIAKYFEGSLKELSLRNPEVSSRFKRVDSNHITAVAYKNGETVTQCKIWLAEKSLYSSGIAYSTDISSSDNSLNDSISVESDGHILFLKAMGMSYMGLGKEDSKLSQEGAAEYFWERFITQLQC